MKSESQKDKKEITVLTTPECKQQRNDFSKINREKFLLIKPRITNIGPDLENNIQIYSEIKKS